MSTNSVQFSVAPGVALHVLALPGRNAARLRVGDGKQPVFLEEASEYRYCVEGIDGPIEFEPAEIFLPDDLSGRAGRLRTGLFTGWLSLQLFRANELVGVVDLEIRSRRLTFEDDYRRMLGNIAELTSDLVLQRFAPTAQRLQPLETAAEGELYQRFAFLRESILNSSVRGALRQIACRPHVEWTTDRWPRTSSRGSRSRSSLAREYRRPGPQRPWHHSGLPHVRTIPRVLMDERPSASVDAIPNQFVKHVLLEWRSLATQVDERLGAEPLTGPTRRGKREVREVIAFLDEVLESPVFRQVTDLLRFPGDNQVLQKRSDYRTVLQRYALTQFAAELSWEGGDDVYGAGQKNVAALYEYWCFLTTATVVSSLCGRRMDFESLVVERPDGWGLRLKQGRSLRLAANPTSFPHLDIELWFNPHFSRDVSPARFRSWTIPMRPDISLYVRSRRSPVSEGVWIHFDAKYRVDHWEGILAGGHDGDPGTAKREDILKMHTYRDAVHGSLGAYVLFPGTDGLPARKHSEILPGLGAFPLRPSESGEVHGAAELRAFLDEVFTHIAAQGTQDERSRFWTRRAIAEPGAHTAPGKALAAVTFLEKPPADTRVLLGFVRSRAQLAFIRKHLFYNLRADPDRRGAVTLNAAELAAEFVVLYDDKGIVDARPVVGPPRVLSRALLEELGYPSPGGTVYLCLPIAPYPLELPSWLHDDHILSLAPRSRAPLATTWLTIQQACAAPC